MQEAHPIGGTAFSLYNTFTLPRKTPASAITRRMRWLRAVCGARILQVCNAVTNSSMLLSFSMTRSSGSTWLLSLWLPFAVHAASTFQGRCLSFTPEAYIHNSSRHVLEYVAAGTNLSLPDNDPTCNRSSQLVAKNICRVGLSIPTSNRSSISMELWLPEDWSERFLVTGNGGIDGCKLSISRAWCMIHLIH